MSLNDKDVLLGAGEDDAGRLNDMGFDEFDNQLEDEYMFDAHPPPGTEIGILEQQDPLHLAQDIGSGSYADGGHYQGGRLEVAEDDLLMNGEAQLGAMDYFGPQSGAPVTPLPAVLPPGKQGVDWAQSSEDGKVYTINPVTKMWKLWVPPPFKRSVRGFMPAPSAPAQQPTYLPSAPAPTPAPTVSDPGNIVSSPLDTASDVMDMPSVMDTPTVMDDSAGREQRKVAATALLSKFNKLMRTNPAAANKEYKKLRAAISAIGSAAMYGPTEIGAFADEGGSEIGAAAQEGASEIGSAAMYGPTEIGQYAADGASEIGEGYYPTEGAAEIGAGYAPMDGSSEIGDWAPEDQVGADEDIQAPFEAFMLDDVHMGAGWAAMEGQSEIGKAKAVVKVVEKARDNRTPPPPLKAVDPEEPLTSEDDDWALTDTFVGVAKATGNADPFPLTSQFLLRAGGAMEPRFVRIDTEESYKHFRTDNSPELSELKARVEDHISDPYAHEKAHDELSDDIEDLVVLGAEAQEAEAEKRVELWMPRRFDGELTAWKEGDFVCASIRMPWLNGETRICTTMEPVQKCIAEMGRHAAEAKVPAAAIIGVLPAMGCVLGAGTGIKEMAAAAPSILSRPEAQHQEPFVVRVEPKINPALSALAMLVMACRKGNKQACDEWKNLSAVAPAVVKQAMTEAVALVKAVA